MDTPTAYLFVSDLHLGGFDEEKNVELERDFVDLIEYALLHSITPVIHGDLFDYYMQYGDFIPEIARVPMETLRVFNSKAQRPAIIVTGNHDNWDDGYFKLVGCELSHESVILEIDNKKVLIAHGDGLLDPQYFFPRPLFHRVLRNSRFVRLFKTLTTPAMGNEIMRRFSLFSRHNSNNIPGETKRVDLWAKAILGMGMADVVICGHHHNIRYVCEQTGLYINTGCFYRDKTFALYNNEGYQLVKWDSATKDIQIIDFRNP